jgi:hypothetical protein
MEDNTDNPDPNRQSLAGKHVRTCLEDSENGFLRLFAPLCANSPNRSAATASSKSLGTKIHQKSCFPHSSRQIQKKHSGKGDRLLRRIDACGLFLLYFDKKPAQTDKLQP